MAYTINNNLGKLLDNQKPEKRIDLTSIQEYTN